jgi:Aspartyl protease
MGVRRFWRFITLTCLAVAGQPDARGYPDYSSARQGRGSASFELYRGYLIVVRGSIGPLKGLHFLFDTGATPSVLDPRLKQQLHLVTSPQSIAVLNGTVQGETATVPRLEIGPIHRDNVSVLIQDLSFIQKVLPVRIDGIVGLDVLGQNPFEVDYAAREIRFGPLPFMKDSIPFQWKEGLAVIDAVVNRSPVHLLVDTGASSLILFGVSQHSARKPTATHSEPSSNTIGDFDRNHTQSISLRLGKTQFQPEAAFVVPHEKDPVYNFDGLISPVALGITRVAVDPSRRTLAFTREP